MWYFAVALGLFAAMRADGGASLWCDIIVSLVWPLALLGLMVCAIKKAVIWVIDV